MSGLSVPNYNPYSFGPMFKADSTNRPSSPKTQFAPQYDSFTNVSSETNKKGLSNKSIALGTIGVLGLGALAYVLSRGKVGSKSAQHIAEHVKFKPANNIEEARAFANKQLKVQFLHEDKANLDMVNTVNEWLYREKFVAKNNIPDVIHFEEKDIENPLGLSDKIFLNGKDYISLGINVNFIDKFDKLLERVFIPHGEIDLNRLIKKNNKGIYEVTKPEYQCDNLNKLVQKLNAYNENSTFKDKMEIFDGFTEVVPYLEKISAGKSAKMATFSSDGPFLHEMGHLHHQDTYKLWNEANKKNSEIYQEFKKPSIQNIAGQVSNYAKSDPLEFVAETYKRLRRGQNFSDDVMALYKKYDGPACL